MTSQVQSNFRHRTNLGRVKTAVEIPNLIDIQKTSYDKFLQSDVAPKERKDIGLQGVFKSVFPIRDFDGTSELVFVSYHLDKPKYDVEECRQRGMTYAAPIKVTTQLMVYDILEGGERIVRDIKEQEVYFGEIPLMTETGDVHHQRDGARRRVAAPPQPRRLLRPRQGQDALERQAALFGAHHPVQRLVARLRVRPQGHHLRAHRSPPKDARDGAASRARLHARRSCSTASTRRRRSTSRRAASSRRASSSICSPASARRATSRSAAKSSSRRTPSSPAPRSRS